MTYRLAWRERALRRARFTTTLIRPKCPVEEHSFQLYEFTDLLVQPPREPPLQRIQRSGIIQTGILTTHHAFDRVLNFLNGF